MAEHRALELAQRRARLDAELVQRPASVLVGVERVLLPPGAVEREDELLAEPLAVRLGGDELLELRDDFAMLAEREPRVEPQLERLEPQILEAGRAARTGLSPRSASASPRQSASALASSSSA